MSDAGGKARCRGRWASCVRGGSLAALNPLANCGIDVGTFRDLFAPVMADLAPQLDQLKAIVAEFEPRIRAITDDPATKAKIEAALPQFRARLEGLADPTTSVPDIERSGSAQQKLVDELKADLEPLTSDAALRAKFDAVGNDLRARLEALAATPDAKPSRTNSPRSDQTRRSKHSPTSSPTACPTDHLPHHLRRTHPPKSRSRSQTWAVGPRLTASSGQSVEPALRRSGDGLNLRTSEVADAG